MVEKVDDDGSGQIEFPEFLKIIKGDENDATTKKITIFFKDLCNGKFGDRQVSFPVFVQQMKRQSIMDAISARDTSRKSEGNKILSNLKEQMIVERNNRLKEWK